MACGVIRRPFSLDRQVFVNHFLRNRAGATAIEYAVICAVIVLAMLAGLTLVGDKTTSSFQNTADKVEGSM